MARTRNVFEQLLKDLNDGTLTYQDLQIAYRAHIRASKVLPEGVKNLLSVAGGGGILGDVFRLIAQITGRMELAYRRGFTEGVACQRKQTPSTIKENRTTGKTSRDIRGPK